MRFFRWLFIIFILLLLLVGGFLYSLNDTRVLNKIVSTAISQSGHNVSYKKLEGGLYSGFKIEDFNYEDKIKGDLKFKLDFGSLKSRIVRVNDLNISNLKIDREFLKSLTKGNQKESTSTNKELPIKEIFVDSAHIDLSDLAYQEYQFKALRLNLKDFHYDLKDDLDAKIDLVAKTNVGDIKADVKVEDFNYDAKIEADLNKEYLAKYTKDANITIDRIPHIDLKAKGDLKDVDFKLNLSDGKLVANGINILLVHLNSNGRYEIENKNLKNNLDLLIKTPLANLKLDADDSLKLDDLNDTLNYQLQAKLTLKGELLKDKNISFVKNTPLIIDLKGDAKRLRADIEYDSAIKYSDMQIDAIIKNSRVDFDIVDKNLTSNIIATIDSNKAKIDLMADAKLDLDDLNNTLSYKAKSLVYAKKELFSNLVDNNITLTSLSPLKLDLKGDAKGLDAKFGLDGELRYNELIANPSIKDSCLHYDLNSNELTSKLNIALLTNRGNVDIKSDVKLNAKDINNTLDYKLYANIKDAKEFEGIDLSSLGDITLKADGTLKNLVANLNSKKITADVKSGDFKKFDFKLDTKKIKLYKIYKKLPPDLNQSFVELRAGGSYNLPSQELDLKAKLKGFKYNNKIITTNEFNLHIKDKEITLSPTILQSGDFRLNAKIQKRGDDLIATIKNKAFSVDAKLRLDPLAIRADGEIRSIKSALKEINKIYPVDESLGVDGRVIFRVRTNNNKIKATLTSPKITLKEGRLEKLDLMAIYEPNRITLKRFNFDMRGFGSKSANKNVRLARDGIITFDGEDASIDIELKNLAKFKAIKKGENIDARLSTNSLSLAYPNYGKINLTTDLTIKQRAKKRKITGELILKDTQINYESRYLDVSKDSDIIIVNGKDENEDFINNTYLDIKLLSKDNILYKVRAGEIEMKPNIKIHKNFGSTPRITGKIKILGGEYDLADKRFKIKEGAVAFRGLKDVNPLLDLHVAYDDLDEIEIFIDISGDKNRPRLKFSSKPPRPKKDIFSYLLFGMSASESEGAMSSANKAAERIFGRAISKDLARELHLDRLDLTRNIDGGIDVKAGKKVNKKTIIYYQNKNTQSSVIVERKLSKDWDVTIEGGKDGEAVDFVYRRGFR